METRTAWVITACYFVIACIGISHHELWGDEAHHLLLARDSGSVAGLVYNARYDGHPLVFDLVLFAVMHTIDSVFAAQLINVLLSAACVFLVLRHAPFTAPAKLLICFGYFLLFEYSVICRNYAISLLFFLLVLIMLFKTQKNFILLFCLLAVFMNTHFLSALLAVALLPVTWPELRRQKRSTIMACCLIFNVALLLCYLQVRPPSDHFLHDYNTSPALSEFRLLKAIRTFLSGLFPLPDFSKQNFWSNMLVTDLSNRSSYALFALFLLVPGRLFRQSKRALILFYTGAVLLFLFFYFSPTLASARHGGFAAMLLLGACWIRKGEQAPSDRIVQRLSFLFFGVILCIQFAAGVAMFYSDLHKKFTSAGDAAAFIDTTIDPRTPVILTHFSGGPAVALFCNHPLIYLENNSVQTFCRWNTRPVFISDSAFISRLQERLLRSKTIILLANRKEDSLRIVNSPLYKQVNFTKLRAFNDGMIMNENFTIYRIDKK